MSNASSIPYVSLQNAADPTLKMPVTGLGTWAYHHGCNPEIWNNTVGYDASVLWFSAGGRRWDSAAGYGSHIGVAQALLNLTNNYTTTPRSEIFITMKIGDSGKTLGYNDTIQTFNETIQEFQTDYFDLLLIHWPSHPGNHSTSSDPTCNTNTSAYNPTICRQHTWRALIDLYLSKKVKAIGVSNFEKTHLMDIFNMNDLLPAVNQFEFHGYWHEYDLVEFCQSYGITVNSYTPLGAPDVTCDNYNNWTYTLPEHPVATDIAAKYKKTGAQIWLKWQLQQGIVVNPRTQNITHMKENLDFFDFELNQEEMFELGSINAPQYPNNKLCPDPHLYP